MYYINWDYDDSRFFFKDNTYWRSLENFEKQYHEFAQKNKKELFNEYLSDYEVLNDIIPTYESWVIWHYKNFCYVKTVKTED